MKYLRYFLLFFNILFFFGVIVSSGEKNITYPTEVSVNNPSLFIILAILNIVSLWFSNKWLPILKIQLLVIGLTSVSVIVAALFILGEFPIINTNKIFSLTIFFITGIYNFVVFIYILGKLILLKKEGKGGTFSKKIHPDYFRRYGKK